MGKEVREILRFFVVPPRGFASAVCALLTHFLTHKSQQLSTYSGVYIFEKSEMVGPGFDT